MYIVGEYLFLENLIINYLILQSTKVITKSIGNRKRIILTSILAALYPFALFFQETMFLSNFYMKFIISVLIVKIAFNAKSLALYIKQLSAFYTISFIFAGASLGLYYFINNYSNNLLRSFEIFYGFPLKYLIFGIVIGEVMIKNILKYYYSKLSKEKELIQVLISLNSKSSSITALIDTGNSLIEPISKLPVFVVEYSEIENLLPNNLKDFYIKENLDYTTLENIMSEMNNQIRFNLIPFKSIGASNGVLLGFKPDYIWVSDTKGIKEYENLLIGIYNGKLSTDEQYKGLVNLDILEGGKLYVKEGYNKN